VADVTARDTRAALAELAARIHRAAEVLADASRLPAAAFDGRAAEAFRRRAVRSARATVAAAGVVAGLAGHEEGPSHPRAADRRDHPPVLPPGARGGSAAPTRPPPRRPRATDQADGTTDGPA